MEHILQFAINIDDKTIEERVYETASKQLTDALKEQIYVSKNYYNHGFTDEATRVIKEVVESYKPEIIEMAAKTLADSILKSKRQKESLAQAIINAEKEA